MIERALVAVLVPAYNEERHLAAFLDRLAQERLHVLVVDDGSTDGTSEIARSKGVETVRLERNGGKGAALREGFRRLAGRGFEWIVIMDGDGQHLPSDIGGFLRAAAAAPGSVVNGNRLDDPRGMPAVRKWTNLTMSAVISAMARTRIRDSQCGFKMLPAAFLRRAELRCDRFEIEDEILLEAARLGFGITHAPVTSVYGNEDSHIHPLRDTARFLRFVLRRLASGRKRGV